MNIAGVLVSARPEHLPRVRSQLLELPGVEIHAQSQEGRLVVTVEERAGQRLGDTILKLNNLDGVLSAAMVYHHNEDDMDMNEEEGTA